MRSDPTKLWANSSGALWNVDLAGMPTICECESPAQQITKIGREVPSRQRVIYSRAEPMKVEPDSCLQTRAARTFGISRLSWRP